MSCITYYDGFYSVEAHRTMRKKRQRSATKMVHTKENEISELTQGTKLIYSWEKRASGGT